MLDRARNLSTVQKILLGLTAVLTTFCVMCCGCVGLIALLPSDENQVAAESAQEPINTALSTNSTELEQTILERNEEITGDSATGDLADGDFAAVTRIIDGDTIEVEINGQTYRVRYIGMDTPERGDPYFDEATEANRQLVEGQIVTLVKDVSETDRYGRLLRYIYLSDGTFVNAELVKQGYALVATFPPDVRHQELFVQLQQEARDAGSGLWGQAVATLPPASQTPQPSPPSASNCDPSYPTVCIPPSPPDLDCGQISHRNFTVLEPDPHGFDRDNDGIGCES